MTNTLSDSPGSLAGMLLLATPGLHDGHFDKSVIYLCEHTPMGAMGIIVNQPSADLKLEGILQELRLPVPSFAQGQPLYYGGPVEGHRGFVVHSDETKINDTITSGGGVAVTASIDILKNLAHGMPPRHYLLALGYAGWGPGQLESELESGSWITVPASQNLVFGTDNELKWAQAAASLGVDFGRLSSEVGHA